MASKMLGPQNSQRDYYKILGVDTTADSSAIRRQRNILALKYHPDKTFGDADALAKFKDVQEAFECLVNPSTRDAYDSARPPTESELDNDGVYDEVDQKIWDGWHASFTGRKGSSSSQAERNGSQNSASTSSAAAGVPGSSEDQQFNSAFHTPNRKTAEATQTAHAPRSNVGYVWISSDDEDGKQGDQNGEQDGQEKGEQDDEEPDEEDDVRYEKDKSTISTPVASHWSFFDYFDADFNEKPLLPEMRDEVALTRREWRLACKKADHAKVDVRYAESPEKKIALQGVYDFWCKKRDTWAHVKHVREKNVRIHEGIAKDRMKARKKKDKDDAAALRKAQARAAQQSSRRQRRGGKAPATAFNPLRGNTPGALRRDADESADEWAPKNMWKP